MAEIAQEAITNVSAIVKKIFNEDIKDYDVYIQFPFILKHRSCSVNPV